MYDGEVVDRLLKSLSRCRSCGHVMVIHVRSKPAGIATCLEPILSNKKDKYHISCKCKEFIPSDNIEYLEYLNEKSKGE